MIEKIGDEEALVRNYTDNFNIKEYIMEELVPKAFPDIPMTKLNLGFTGVVSEYIAQGIEDAQSTASLMLNEAFITKASLANSIYAQASLFDLGYTFATPSRCNFALQLALDDVINNSSPVQNSDSMRFILDKNTKLLLGDNTYTLDYDVYIDHTFIDGKRVFNIYYNIDETNSISLIESQYIKHQVSSINWLILVLELQEYERITDEEAITDNLVTTNSDIKITWTNQIAGIDATYISPTGQRRKMKLKPQYTRPDIEPFAWYRFEDDNTIILSFSSNKGYWSPEFNSMIEYTVYSCRGAAANFTSYDRKTAVPVEKTGDVYEYNNDTIITAMCYSGSSGGADKGDIEDLRDNIIMAYNTANVLSTDRDLQLWFDNYGKRHGTRASFFKRRDDPSGRLFSQFIAITDNTYVYPTNTLDIRCNFEDFDYVTTSEDGTIEEMIIKAGHIWEYDDSDDEICRTRLRMVTGTDGTAKITDEVLPTISDSRPFMFVNPFLIKIHREPATSINYNYLVSHVSWPEEEPIQTSTFYQFQLAQFSIERTLTTGKNNMYHIEVICVPVITTDTDMVYVAGIGDDFPKTNNNLRLVLITRSKLDGETGYIEMTPTELRNSGSVLFATDICVYDNLRNDMMLEIDLDNTPEMRSLISTGPRKDRVFIDSEEASFHFACMINDPSNKRTTRLFDNESFDGYIMANRFRNNHRDLTLYKPLSMMLSTITFDGTFKVDESGSADCSATVSLIPMLRYDIPLDDDKMDYFIQSFADQYAAVEPILSRLDGDLDFKLYNTYGRSNNYYIGPQDGEVILRNSNIILDNVYVKVKMIIAVNDRSMYTQTVNEVMNQIIECFESLNTEDQTDIHVSDIIHSIYQNTPNVRYLRFLGFNDYDANKQSIFVKYNSISELDENQLRTKVPEMIRVDTTSISITEET